MSDTFTDPRNSFRQQLLLNLLSQNPVQGITNPIVQGLTSFGRSIGGALVGRGLAREQEEQQQRQAATLANLIDPTTGRVRPPGSAAASRDPSLQPSGSLAETLALGTPPFVPAGGGDIAGSPGNAQLAAAMTPNTGTGIAINRPSTPQVFAPVDPNRQQVANLLRGNPELAQALGPSIIQNVVSQAFPAPGEPFTLGPRETRFGPGGQVIAQGVEPEPERTTLERNLIAGGLTPGTPAFQRAILERTQRGGITINNAPNGVQFPDPPTDFVYRRNPDGTVRVNEEGLPELVAIPGSDTARKRRSAQQADVDKATQARRFADVVTQDIDRVLNILDESAITGPFSLTQAVPGTPANDAARLIDTVRANVGFDRLQALRDASPTGGALGQVSEQENRLLQSTLGNLELSQSETQFRTNLQRLKRVYLDIIHGPGNRPRLPQPVVVTEGQQAAGQTPQRPEGPNLESLTPQDLQGLTDEQLRSLLQ